MELEGIMLGDISQRGKNSGAIYFCRVERAACSTTPWFSLHRKTLWETISEELTQ